MVKNKLKMIFLSYSWRNDEIANSIDSFFSQNGVTIQRDRRDLKYKQSIKEFMNSIRNAEYVIMIISEEYLQSKNCMYEVMEFVKNFDFQDKIIPVITENAKIFDIYNKIEFHKYWVEKTKKLEESFKYLDPLKSIHVIEELKEYKHIETEILNFLKIISDMKNIVLSDDEFKEIHFDTITNFLELENVRMKNIVLNYQLVKSENVNTSDVIEYISKVFIDFQVYSVKDEKASFKFKTFKTIQEIKNGLLTKFGEDNFKKIDCFNYDDAYYIAGKKKIVEYNSKSIIWWGHFQNGYTENLKSAGLYSFEEIEKIIKFEENSYKKEQLGIKAKYVDNLDLSIIPIDTKYSQILVQNSNKIYGISDWKDYEGFS